MFVEAAKKSIAHGQQRNSHQLTQQQQQVQQINTQSGNHKQASQANKLHHEH